VTAVPYVPDDLTFEIATDGSVTLHFGEWISEQLESVASSVVPCSARRLKARAGACGYGSYVQLMDAPQNQPLVIRLRAATPEPLEEAIEATVNSDAQVVNGFAGLGLPVVTPGTLGAITAYGGATGFIAVAYVVYSSLSSNLGSGSNGGKIPSAITIKPNPSNGSPGSTTNDNPNSCPSDVLDFVSLSALSETFQRLTHESG
jgi:hypothetical protein